MVGGEVGDAEAQASAQAQVPGVIFHPASGVKVNAVGQAQITMRRRILRARTQIRFILLALA